MAKRAAKTSLPGDATLSDVVGGLDKPVEFVRRILEKLERCRRAHGDAQVRIGVKGRTECPNYLIEFAVEDAKTHKTTVKPDAAYSGSTHRELAPRHIEEAANWSPEEMNIDAVSALIGRLRNPATDAAGDLVAANPKDKDMAIKFSAKEPAKVETAKVVKESEVKRVSVDKPGAPADTDSDLFETETKSTTRKPKSK